MRLAARISAYGGATAHTIAARRQERQQGGKAAPQRRTPPRYERNSPMANNARVAESAPPATAAALTALNAQLGGWFSHRIVPADDRGGEEAP